MVSVEWRNIVFFPSFLPLINYCSYCVTSTLLGSGAQWGSKNIFSALMKVLTVNLYFKSAICLEQGEGRRYFHKKKGFPFSNRLKGTSLVLLPRPYASPRDRGVNCVSGQRGRRSWSRPLVSLPHWPLPSLGKFHPDAALLCLQEAAWPSHLTMIPRVDAVLPRHVGPMGCG